MIKQLCFSLSLLLLSSPLFANIWYTPKLPVNTTEQSIKISNLEAKPAVLEIYIRRMPENNLEIHTLDIEANKELFISLQEFAEPKDVVWFKAHLNSQNQLKLFLDSGAEYVPLPESLSNQWVSNEDKLSKRLYIQNNSALPNTIYVETFSKAGKNLGKTKHLLKAFTTKEILRKRGSHRIKVQSEFSSLAYYKTKDSRYEFLAARRNFPKMSDDQKRFFVVESPGNPSKQSYILTLEKPEQIAMALRAIREPQNENIPRIITGFVSKSSQVTNFNPENPYQLSWSWELVEPEFIHLGMIDCDTNPRLVEEQLPEYTQEKTRICPWAHRITREWKP